MHTAALGYRGDSVAHRLPPQVKIVCAATSVLCIVATSRERFLAFGLYLLVLLAVWFVARVNVRWVAKRSMIELPFVALALLLPFVASGQRTSILGVSVSVAGALAGWNILVKGTLGVLVTLTLPATTEPNDLLVGLRRLRVPAMLVTIASLMLRYVELIVAETRRMRVARICRGHNPRLLWQAGATARGIGMLFLRSYERGERVHRAMLARGFDGTMPELTATAARARHWLAGLMPAMLTAAVLGATWWTN